MNKVLAFFSKPLFSDRKFIFSLWMLVALFVSMKHIFRGFSNNFLIFRGVFYHVIDRVNLYVPYPEYFDTNHYGPVFSLIIAPFALLPVEIGNMLWCLTMAFVLFYAIYRLPVAWHYRVIILYIPLHDLFTSLLSVQTNPLIAALIIGSYIAVRKEKEGWAACFIILGLFIKLYTIIGLAFFLFSKNKRKFILYLILWTVIFFVLPMFISSPRYIVQCYIDWYHSLVGKNVENTNSLMQDISVMGMIRRIFSLRTMSNLFVLIPALILFGMQYIGRKWYGNLSYQLSLLASSLLFIVLFSSGSESVSYVMAMTGVAIWFVVQDRPSGWWAVFLLVFCFVLTSFSNADFIPKFIRHGLVRDYALKALPCFLVWLALVYQLIIPGKNFTKNEEIIKE